MNGLRDKERQRAAAEKHPDPTERSKLTQKAEQELRDATRAAALGIANTFLKPDDRKEGALVLEGAGLAWDRLAQGKDVLPSLAELTKNAAGEFSPAVFASELESIRAFAKALGLEAELNTVVLGLKGAQAMLDGDLSDALSMGGLVGTLGFASGLANMLGGNKILSDATKVAQAADNFLKYCEGDLEAGIGALLSLDGIIPIPPVVKKALEQLREMLRQIKPLASLRKPISVCAPGVYVEKRHVAARGLSGTVCGITLSPGPGAMTVRAYGAPLWRANSDFHICPIPGSGGSPHAPAPGGQVVAAAKTVTAEGNMVARHGDQTTEANGGGPVTIVPLPEAMAIALARVEANNQATQRQAEAAKHPTGTGSTQKPSSAGKGAARSKSGDVAQHPSPRGETDSAGAELSCSDETASGSTQVAREDTKSRDPMTDAVQQEIAEIEQHEKNRVAVQADLDRRRAAGTLGDEEYQASVAEMDRRRERDIDRLNDLASTYDLTKSAPAPMPPNAQPVSRVERTNEDGSVTTVTQLSNGWTVEETTTDLFRPEVLNKENRYLRSNVSVQSKQSVTRTQGGIPVAVEYSWEATMGIENSLGDEFKAQVKPQIRTSVSSGASAGVSAGLSLSADALETTVGADRSLKTRDRTKWSEPNSKDAIDIDYERGEYKAQIGLRGPIAASIKYDEKKVGSAAANKAKWKSEHSVR